MRACLFTTILIAATFASACTAPTGELALKSATFHTPVAPPPVAGTMFFSGTNPARTGWLRQRRAGHVLRPGESLRTGQRRDRR